MIDQSTELMKRASLLTDNLVAITDPARIAARNLAATSASLEAMVDENRAALRETLGSIRQTVTGASELLDGQVAQLFVDAGDFVS
jgi:ABC-type transporter Mla subunit MlaD